jgi:hypothetical protein
VKSAQGRLKAGRGQDCPPHHNNNDNERGSALLIVFVFAAMIAIFLYREMPVTVFEARRQKEQLLEDRGKEYVRAVQLFYRRNRGQFPSSIEQLENTNNIRYLRRKYKDPFTGKDDWRLLHAGPNGILIDSKVNPLQANGTNGQPGQANGSSPSGFGAGSSPMPIGSSSTDSSSGDSTVAPPLMQRGPAVQANGGGASGSDQPPTSAQLDQNPDAPIVPPSSVPPGVGITGRGGPPIAVAPGGPGGSAPETAGGPQAPNAMQTLSPLLSNPTTPAAGQGQSTAFGGGQQPGFGSQQTGFGSQPTGFGGSMGQMNGGGALAGVASKAKGHSIKLVDDQSDYSLWEFHYDPTKDTGAAGGAGQGQGQMPGQLGAPAQNGTNGQTTSGFGSSQTSFGSQSTPSQTANQPTPPAPLAPPVSDGSSPQ